jgi:hypothetical protein
MTDFRMQGFAFVLCTLSWAASARADVIPDDYEPPECPPMTCPPASYLASPGHGSCPVGCVPSSIECTSDAECVTRAGQNSRCVETSFCTETQSLGRAGNQPVIRGQCRADDSCETGTCTRARRCTQPIYAAAEEEDDEACSAGGRAGAIGASLALVAGLLLRRRRRT